MWKKLIPEIKLGVTSRITIIIILVAVVSAGSSGLIAYYISQKQFADYVYRYDKSVGTRYALLAGQYYQQYGSLDGLQAVMPLAGNPGSGRIGGIAPTRRVLITDKTGIIVADSDGELTGFMLKSYSQDYHKYPVDLKGTGVIGNIYVFSPLKRGFESLENNFLRDVKQKIADSITIFALMALLVGLLLASRITRPIKGLSSAIHEVARGNLEVRADVKGDREFMQLASDFNQMAQKLYEHEQNRNALFANIAHELRTPLSIIRGDLEAVQAGSLQMTEEMKSSLVDEIIRLTKLVKDLETVGLTEAGALNLNITDISTEEMLDSILPLRLGMEEDGISFKVALEPGLDSFRADRQRLTQILINLLSNAMRHSTIGSGSIELAVRSIDSAVEFSIKDNGPGINEEDLPHIFERFYRVDKNHLREYSGAGLGLAIAKSYVEAHGGSIGVKSKPGQGSEFYFTLPQ